MSYHPFFSMSTGFKKAIVVPAGTVKRCQDHVAGVESLLGIKSERYRRNPRHWIRPIPIEGVSDEVLCKTAMEHNAWVRHFFTKTQEWSKAKPTGDTEKMTPRDAQTFWHGLEDIKVPTERWTDEYYRDRMNHLYEVMRGNESEGVTFDEKPLTPRQAAQVINMFSFLDPGDARLDVPRGCDYLASSEDGGYDWCERSGCGAMHPDDWPHCLKRGCPIRAEFDRDDE